MHGKTVRLRTVAGGISGGNDPTRPRDRVIQRWVDLYTRGLPKVVRSERRAEVDADIWEESSGTSKRSILARTARGVVSDLTWRAEQTRLARGGAGRRQHTHAPRRLRAPHDRAPRGPGFVYAAAALVLMVLVASLALTSRRSAPPTIAEFAPQAVGQITDPSGDASGQASQRQGEASTADAEAVEHTSSSQEIDVARVRRCVGDPPRQIEDPQSPPCVPYWSGDNGGATWRGVTRDEIRVVLSGEWEAGINPVLVSFFNRRFEFYGRQIRMSVRPTPGPEDPAGQRAVARAVYEEDRAFASGTFWYSDHAYFDELGRLGVVGAHISPLFPETHLAARRPYLWTYAMANDRVFATTGNWYCSRFAGRNAVHAGDPVLQTSRRKPGIVLGRVADWDGTSAEPMNAQLDVCGERTDAVVESTIRMYDTVAYEEFMQNAILQMKTAGVTTLTCFCDWQLMAVGMRAATNQGYFPEWILSSYIGNDWSNNVRLFGPPEQTGSVMALSPQPMERPQPEHPSNWAIQEVTSSGPEASRQQQAIDGLYRMWLLLASGLQLAGPDLTPQTFERGLHRAAFPNSPHPIMAGAVGFRDATGPDHSMTDDVAEMWWSNTERTPYQDWLGGRGVYCYVDHGARRLIGGFPTDDPFFSGPCDTGSA